MKWHLRLNIPCNVVKHSTMALYYQVITHYNGKGLLFWRITNVNIVCCSERHYVTFFFCIKEWPRAAFAILAASFTISGHQTGGKTSLIQCFSKHFQYVNNKKQACKPRRYASSKLTWLKCRATSEARRRRGGVIHDEQTIQRLLIWQQS